MIKANKTSLIAKAYINGKVNDMREKFREAPDEEAKKQLVETFRETTSSEEYKENLRIVNEDAKAVRKSLKPWERKEKFGEAKEDFYWKLNLYFGSEDLEERKKMDNFEKIDFLFKKLWDWDRTLSVFLDLADAGPGCSWHNRRGESVNWWDSDYESWMFHMWKNKFHNLSLKITKKLLSVYPFYGLILHDPDAFSDEVRQDPEVFSFIKRNIFERSVSGGMDTDENLSIIFDKMWKDKVEKLVQYVDTDNFVKVIKLFKDRKDVNDIIDELARRWDKEKINDSRYIYKKDSIEKYENFIRNIVYSMYFDSDEWLRPYQKRFADAFIKAWYVDIIRSLIEHGEFKWLTDEEKSEILWRDLVKEKFDADLAKLQELWAKLWKQIVVEDVEEDVEEGSVHFIPETPVAEEDEDVDVHVIGTKKKRRGWFRRK